MNENKNLKLEVSGRIVTVTLNRPDVRNAFQPEMIRELKATFQELSKRQDISAIVLKGEGKSFCSGADLGYMKSMAGFTFEENVRDSGELFDMFWAMRTCPHPIIARVHGHAMGGALGLIAVSDVVGAVEGTQFCFSEVKLGLAPAVISPFVLERMAVSHARRYMLTGEVFGTDEALRSGLVHFAGDAAAVDAFIEQTSKTISRNGPEGVRATKTLLMQVSAENDWSKRRELTTRVIAERRAGAEGQEGLRAFFEKREPNWRPKE